MASKQSGFQPWAAFVLAAVAAATLSHCGRDAWTAYVYPSMDLETYFTAGTYETFEQCQE